MDDEAVRSAMAGLFERYAFMLRSNEFADNPPSTGSAHLRWMCATAIAHVGEWPVDKTGRWLGFIQGVLIMRGVTTVEDEREHSRPVFHAAYGFKPETLDRLAPVS